MAKSRSFSIYLLKEGFSPENALKEGHTLELIQEDNTSLPENAIMYISNKQANPPWWKSYWGINKNLSQSQKGALVFLKVNENWIVLTFGSTYHQLKDEAYAYDFGIRTTLNALDPTKIRSTDILQPENAKRQRIQSPIASELNFFSFNSDETILKKMTGAVKNEYIDLFKNITGGNSLRISSNLQSDKISGLCEELIEIYGKEDYKTSFPELQNIVPVKDPILLSHLKSKLVEAFNEDPAPLELVLAIPEIFDYSIDYKIKYSGEGSSRLEFSDVYIKGYREYLQDRGVEEIKTTEKFSKHKLRILDDNETLIKEYSIYKSLLFDCEYNDNVYHLCEGEWYLIEKDFIQKLAEELDPIFIEKHDFLHQCEKKREDHYNGSISDVNQDVICLDKKNISPNGQYQVEPCDLIYIKDDYLELAHIKISTRSSSLSHLFNQGVNSVELLRRNDEAKKKLLELVQANANMETFINDGKYRITYGIISKKVDKKSIGLPIFSRISLLRIVNTLKTMNIPVQILYIYDNVDRKNLAEEENE
ncbi:DUF6119 family protein [Avrilella dinanensis]|uniref:Sporadically distributed protein, TIGR04141 family n=1 Tax=Avrilella dinanensis TaxID=2008672 RepID=A0A2M9R2P7_9FLAO|nr:DUF6119 family protein [Avrilella dinanensis]PJR03122.1 hypothetical protein CDL10_00380 [Avrilella dinanensis]